MKKNTIASFIFSVFCVTISVAQTPVKLNKTSFSFAEGPAWDGGEFVYFTDLPKSKVMKYSMTTELVTTAFENSNKANGLMFNKDNKLTVCEGTTGKVTLREVDGTLIETLASTFGGKGFNSPNDLCYDSKGGLYFTDPTTKIDPNKQPTNAIYYRQPDGTITKQDDYGSEFPNGVIISHDGLYLYADNSFTKDLYRYDIDPNTGTLSNKTLYAEIPDVVNSRSKADGMAVDTAGKLYVAVRDKIRIYDGTKLTASATISFPEGVTNCTFVGAQRNLLFVTGKTNVYTVDLSPVKGIRHPFDLPGANLSAKEFQKANNISLLKNPINPKSENVIIVSTETYSILDAQLLSMNGQLVDVPKLVGDKTSKTLKLNSNLVSGTYFLKIKTTKGNKSQKLMIKNN